MTLHNSNNENFAQNTQNDIRLDWNNDVTPPPYASQPAIRRFGNRTAVAAHQGFGFGAQAIREKSLQVAREATELKNSRLHEMLSAPINMSSQPKSPNASHSSSISTSNSAPIVEPAPASGNSKKQHSQTFAQVIPPKIYGSNATTNNETVNSNSRKATSQNTAEITVGRAILAWILDSVVACSAFVISMGASYVSANPEIGTPIMGLLDRLNTIAGIGSPFLIIMLFKVFTGALGIIFVAQLSMLLATGGTAGRFAMGIKLANPKLSARILGATAAAIFETFTLGGVLAFPFVLSIPSRIPLTPWLQYKTHEN